MENNPCGKSEHKAINWCIEQKVYKTETSTFASWKQSVASGLEASTDDQTNARFRVLGMTLVM